MQAAAAQDIAQKRAAADAEIAQLRAEAEKDRADARDAMDRALDMQASIASSLEKARAELLPPKPAQRAA